MESDQSRPPTSHGADPGEDDAWLARPASIRLLWWIFAAVLALSVAAQVVVKVKGYFDVDGWFAFGAVYGFLACLLMVVFAKVLGGFVKRSEDFYGVEEDD
jgi:hypothetical protein